MSEKKKYVPEGATKGEKWFAYSLLTAGVILIPYMIYYSDKRSKQRAAEAQNAFVTK